MPSKVPPTDSGKRNADDACESLLSEFAPDASPETRAALRAALRAASAGGASIELDPALDLLCALHARRDADIPLGPRALCARLRWP